MLMIASCSSESNLSKNKINISAKATYANTAGRTTYANGLPADVVVTSFKINIRKLFRGVFFKCTVKNVDQLLFK